MMNQSFITWTFRVISLFIPFFASSQYNLRVADVRNTSYSYQGTIEEALLSVKPKGLYLEYGLYLSFSARGLPFRPDDSLEIVLQFALPEEAVVTDSWLWIGNEICQAALLDVWTASNIYENIVKRRRDPSLLTKNSSTNFTLRVFPMGGDEQRHVKITYLMPLEWTYYDAFASVPYEILNTSKTIPEDFPLLLFDDAHWKYISVSSKQATSPVRGIDTLLGDYTTTSLLPVAGRYEQTFVSYQPPVSIPAYAGIYTHGEEQYYQLAIQPGFFIDDVQSSRMLILIDYQESGSTSRQQVIDALHNECLRKLQPGDSFNLIASSLPLTEVFPAWVPATRENLEFAFQQASSRLSNYSNLPQLLSAGIAFLDRNGGRGNMLLLNNSDQFNGYSAANDLIQQIRQLNHASYRISVVEYGFQNRYSYFNNRYYINNEYLFLNLSALFGGQYVYTRNGKPLATAISEGFADALPQLKHFDLYVRPASGIAYGKYTWGDALENVPVKSFVRQQGIFKGSLPLTVELNGEANGKVFVQTLTLDGSQLSPLDTMARKSWFAQGIFRLENHPNAASYSIDIIRKSLESRVLSRYTAFLCVEDSSLYCASCRDERVFPTNSDDPSKSDSLVNVVMYPNPFSTELVVELHMSDGSSPKQNWKAHIAALSGKQLATLAAAESNSELMRFRWDGKDQAGSDLPPGVYLLVLENATSRLHRKIIKD